SCEDIFEDDDVPFVLLNGRLNAALSAAAVNRPLALLVDFDALAKCLALAYPEFKRSSDDQVVDLRDPAVAVDPQVMDRHDVWVAGVIEVDQVRGFGLSPLSRFYALDFL